VRTKSIGLGGIASPKDRMRPINPALVASLTKSIRENGGSMHTPLIVREKGGGELGYWLIAGAHRLAAAKRLKWDAVECIVHPPMSDDEALLIEIEENLERGELTPTERAEHVAARAKHYAAKGSFGANVRQNSKRGRQGEGRPKGGVRNAAREMGVGRDTVARSAKVAALPPEVKGIAKASGLSQAALLRVASKPPEEQVRAAREEAEKASRPAQHAKAVSVPQTGQDGGVVPPERYIRDVMAAAGLEGVLLRNVLSWRSAILAGEKPTKAVMSKRHGVAPSVFDAPSMMYRVLSVAYQMRVPQA
jgi:hypothetical protein